jgi:hypothetical protein
VDGGRLVFDIRRPLVDGDEGGDEGGDEDAYVRLTTRIEATGAEYSTTYVGHGLERNGYVSLLEAMRGLPLNDWIFMVHQSDRVAVASTKRKRQEAAMWEFLDECERDGINSVWSSSRAGQQEEQLKEGEGYQQQRPDDAKLVAVRGYLRPDPEMRRALSLSDAESMFNGSYFSSYGPYFRLWELYKSPSVVGNAYLWSPRGSHEEPRLVR